MKRVFSIFLVCLVFVFSIVVPSSAYFAAGITSNGDDLVLAVQNQELYNNTPSTSLAYSCTIDDWFNCSPIFEYTNDVGTIIRYGNGIYTYNDPSYRVYGAMLSGSQLSAYFSEHSGPISSFEVDKYYSVAISLTERAQFGRIYAANGSFNTYNSKNTYVSNSYLCDYGYPFDDPDFYFNLVLPATRFDREFIESSVDLACCSSLFDSFSSLGAALISAETSSPPVSETSYNFSLKPGYAVAMPYSGSFTCVANYTAPKISSAASDHYNLGHYKYLNSVPSSLSFATNDTSGGYNLIPWSPVPPYDEHGYSHDYSAEWSGGGIGIQPYTVLLIFNPMYTPSGDLNNSMSIRFSGRNVSRPRLYEMETKASQVYGSSVYYTFESTDKVIYADIDTSPGFDNDDPEWVSGDAPYIPTVGGATKPPAGGNSLFDFLSSLFEGFEDIFTWGHEAAQNIINGSREFFTALTGIFSWMPPEVLSVLSACLILILIIGVVKVLL